MFLREGAQEMDLRMRIRMPETFRAGSQLRRGLLNELQWLGPEAINREDTNERTVR